MDRLTINDGGFWSVSEMYCYEAVGDCFCGEAIDRLAAYEDTGLTPEEIRNYAEDVAIQYGYMVNHNKGRLHISTGGLSTLERTFSILGWDDPHPYPEGECQWEDCHKYATIGTPTKNGYMRVCSKHYQVIMARKEAEAALKGGNK